MDFRRKYLLEGSYKDNLDLSHPFDRGYHHAREGNPPSETTKDYKDGHLLGTQHKKRMDKLKEELTEEASHITATRTFGNLWALKVHHKDGSVHTHEVMGDKAAVSKAKELAKEHKVKVLHNGKEAFTGSPTNWRRKGQRIELKNGKSGTIQGVNKDSEKYHYTVQHDDGSRYAYHRDDLKEDAGAVPVNTVAISGAIAGANNDPPGPKSLLKTFRRKVKGK